MFPDRRPINSVVRFVAIVATALVLGVAPGDVSLLAQAPPQLPQCVVPPNPAAPDHWPVAGMDLLGAAAGSKTFSSATLLANDTGPSALIVTRVGPISSNGGTIAGSDPYTYTPAALFAGDDSFTYEIRDVAGETTTGVVKITVVADNVAPTVSLAALPATVSGNVALNATAADNVGVAGVQFFDGASLIGDVTSAPFSIIWNTTTVADGSHTLTAVARDGSGNTATSNAVTTNVLNAVPQGLRLASNVSVDGIGAITTPAFNVSAGTVLVALAASDGPPTGTNQTLTISGGGLTWTRVQRAAVQRGDAEIWTATAAAAASITVTSSQALLVNGLAVAQSLTVLGFTGSAGIGVSGIANAATGAPKITLAGVSAGSIVYGTGMDFDNASARAVAANQTKVHEYLAASGDTMWMQGLTSPTAAAGSVILNDLSPTTDRWNFAAVEVKSGTPPASVTVPNVVNMTQANASAAITGAGLAVGTITSSSSPTVPSGSVISQNPTGGSSALAGSSVSLVISTGPAPAGPAAQVTVFADGAGTQTTPAFSTTAAGEVLIALAASDGPTTGVNNQELTISGGGLTWSRVQRAATQRGVAEIWTATATGILSNVTVSSTQSVPTVLGLPPNQSLTVIAFTGASGVGASAVAGGATGGPSVTLTAQAAGSAVYGVGVDFDQAVARTVGAGQTKVHEFLAPSGDTMWMQMLNATTSAAGATARLNDTAPTTDQWNFAIVEIKR